VHDGDQNKTGGDSGEACANVVIPDSNPGVDNTSPSATDIQSQNGGTTIAKMELGDKAIFSFSEAMDPTSILSGWNGSATNVVVRIVDNKAGDRLQVWNATNNTQLALGEVELGGDFSGNITFGASGTPSTMVMSGSSITVTFGTPSGGVKTVSVATTMVWTPSASATDLAGNAMSTTSVTESGVADKDF
jgi:hypothetical protein